MITDDRINELLTRAGSPVLTMQNAEIEADSEKKELTMLYVRIISRRDFGGSVALFFQHLEEIIDRMEAALSNVLDERDQLISDIKKLSRDTYGCDTCSRYVCGCCKHNSNYAVCKNCNLENDSWEWRGVLNDNSISERKD